MLEAALLRGNIAALDAAIADTADDIERASLMSRRAQDQWALRMVTA